MYSIAVAAMLYANNQGGATRMCIKSGDLGLRRIGIVGHEALSPGNLLFSRAKVLFISTPAPGVSRVAV